MSLERPHSEVVLHWFRTDLRVDANPALAEICRIANRLICVFVKSASSQQRLPWGAPRVGPQRATLLNAVLQDLAKELAFRGNELFFVEPSGTSHQAFAEDLVSLAVASRATLLTYVSEVAPEEREQEAAVQYVAKRQGIAVRAFSPSTLTDIDALPFAAPKAPDVFTAFRQHAEKMGRPPLPPVVPARLPKSSSELALLNGVSKRAFFPGEIPHPREVLMRQGRAFCGSRAAALQRVKHYLWETDAAQTYFDTRNLLSGEKASTRFSPWLSLGVLDAREVHAALTAYEGERGSNKSTQWIAFELLWRDFFKVMSLKHGTLLYCEAGLPTARGRAQRPGEDPDSFERNRFVPKSLSTLNEEERFAAWREGRTGLSLVDAALKELHFTGWLSNRARQIAASALVYVLGVRWTWGAWHFESLLVDYDPAGEYVRSWGCG